MAKSSRSCLLRGATAKVRGVSGLLGVAVVLGCSSIVTAGAGTDDGTESAGSEVGDSTLLPTSSSLPGTSDATVPMGPETSTTTTSTSAPSSTSPATTHTTFSTSEGSAESGDSESGDSFGNFITVPDGGVCLGGSAPDGYLAHCSRCSVWDQDCAEGDRCVAWANDGTEFWNATRCSEIDPSPGQVGDPCTVEGSAVSGVDSCGIDSMCFNVDPKTLSGTCVALCGGNQASPECAAGTECVIANEGSIVLCLASCDPLLQDCPADQACYGVGEPEVGDPIVCMREGVGVWALVGALPAMCPLRSTGVPPSLIATCADDEPCCAAWCSVDDIDGCAVGAACVPWADPNAPGLSPHGVCVDG